MKTLLNTHALAEALTAFEDSLTPNEKPLAPDEDGGVNAAAACYRQSEKHAYFAVDLAAISELGDGCKVYRKIGMLFWLSITRCRGVNAAVFVGRKRFFVGSKRVFEGG